MTLQLRDTTDAEIFAGEDITLTCDIQLSEVLIVNVNVSVMVEWHRDGSRLSDSTRITITTTTAGPSEVQSLLSFRPVISSDSGRYRCTAILTSLQGTSSPFSTSQDKQLTVQSMLVYVVDVHHKCDTLLMINYTIPHGTALTLVVQISPTSLDVSPYNQFTVTCTARAEFNGVSIPYSITIKWIRREQTDGGAVMFEDVDPTQYETTVIPDNGYLSILTTTENDTQNMISYRCRAQLTDEGGNDINSPRSATTDVEVQGMFPSVC